MFIFYKMAPYVQKKKNVTYLEIYIPEVHRQYIINTSITIQINLRDLYIHIL